MNAPPSQRQSLLAWFKEWKEWETMRILCNTQASPEEIQIMFANLKVREEAFEKAMHAERISTSAAQNASFSGVPA